MHTSNKEEIVLKFMMLANQQVYLKWTLQQFLWQPKLYNTLSSKVGDKD